MARRLDNHPLFHTRDLDRARSEVAKLHCEHMLTLSKGKRLDAYYNHAPLSQISINYLEYGAEVSINPGRIADFFLLQLPLQGSAFIQMGKFEGLSKPGLASVLSSDEEINMRWSADCQQLLVKIDRAAVEQQLTSLIASPLSDPIRFDLLMPGDCCKIASWWRMIHFLIAELEQGQSLHTTGPAIASLEQSIITNLLYVQPHNYSQHILHRNTAIAPVHVIRAEEYMRRNIAETITIDDLARVADVSPRTLHTGFKHFRHTTPMNYLRKIRLEGARNDLMCAKGGVGVTDIATKWGFNQMGRFSCIYKQAFGESPSETLKRYKQHYQ